MSALLEALDVPAPAGLGDLGGQWDQRVRDALVAVLRDPVGRSRVVASVTSDQPGHG